MGKVRVNVVWLFSAVIVAVVSMPSAAYGKTKAVHRYEKRIAGKYLVIFDDLVVKRPADAAASVAAKYGGKVDVVFRSTLNGATMRMSDVQAERMVNDAAVLEVHEAITQSCNYPITSRSLGARSD